MSHDCRASDADTEEFTLPCVEALLAGTLTLMTGVAQAAPGCANVRPMAAKVVSNLGTLAEHPALSEAMRQVVARLALHWQAVGRSPAAQAPGQPDRTLWLHTPAALQ